MNVLDTIKLAVEKVFKIDDISIKYRDINYVVARFMYYKIARNYKLPKNKIYSLSAIGKVVNRDHSTVLYGLNTVNIHLKLYLYNVLYFEILNKLNIIDVETDIIDDDLIDFNLLDNYIKLPTYIVSHLMGYSKTELYELYDTRLIPFKKMLNTRKKQKVIPKVYGALLNK